MTQPSPASPAGALARAEAFARHHHAAHTRKGAAAEPYVLHLAEVVALVRLWGGDEAAQTAAWLHDTVEDCEGVTADLLRDSFGPEVAAVVMELTDDKSLPKPERKRRQVLNAPHKSPRAALVKCADKTSNVAAVGASPPVHWDQDRREAYIAWGEEVVAALPGLPADARAGFAATATLARLRLTFR